MNWFKRKFFSCPKAFFQQDSASNSDISIDIAPETPPVENQNPYQDLIEQIPSATSFTTLSAVENTTRPRESNAARSARLAMVVSRLANGERPPLPARPSNFNNFPLEKIKFLAEEISGGASTNAQELATFEFVNTKNSFSGNSSVTGNYSKDLCGGYKVKIAPLGVEDEASSPYNFVMDEEDIIRALLSDLRKLQGLKIQDISNMKLFANCEPGDRSFLKQIKYPEVDTSRSKVSNDGSLDVCLSNRLAGRVKQDKSIENDDYQYLTHNIHVDDKLIQMRIGLRNARWQAKEKEKQMQQKKEQEPAPAKVQSPKRFQNISSRLKKASFRFFPSIVPRADTATI